MATTKTGSPQNPQSLEPNVRCSQNVERQTATELENNDELQRYLAQCPAYPPGDRRGKTATFGADELEDRAIPANSLRRPPAESSGAKADSFAESDPQHLSVSSALPRQSQAHNQDRTQETGLESSAGPGTHREGQDIPAKRFVHHTEGHENTKQGGTENEADQVQLRRQLQDRIAEGREQLRREELRFAEETKQLQREYEAKIVQTRKDTTAQQQRVLEKKLAALTQKRGKAGNADASKLGTEDALKQEFEERLKEQLQEERAQLYQELKATMEAEGGPEESRVLEAKQREVKAQLRSSLEEQMRTQFQQEYEDSYEEEYRKIQELVKTQVLQAVMDESQAECDKRVHAEKQRLQKQAKDEIEENTRTIRCQIEQRLVTHIDRLNAEVCG